MDYSTGKLAFIMIVAVVLAALGSWLLAWRYRIAMQRLMSMPAGASRAPVGPAALRAAAGTNEARAVGHAGRPRAAVGLADNRLATAMSC